MNFTELDSPFDLTKSNNRLQNYMVPQVYGRLRRLAQHYLRAEPAGQTLSGTALVHEAFLRLKKNQPTPAWNDVRHFFSVTALTMRRILVDRARQKKRQKNGGQLNRVEFDSTVGEAKIQTDNLTELEDALAEFEKVFPAAAELINLWYFGGLTMAEAAKVIGVSRTTAHRHWQFSKAWLAQRIKQSQD